MLNIGHNLMASNSALFSSFSLAGLSILTVVFLCPIISVDGKYCKSIDVRVKMAYFEERLRGCEVIVGDLQIVLFDNATPEDFEGISFPELREITGLLIFYQVNGLKSIGKLFPNLSHIHGRSLLRDFSFMIVKCADLEEIGLSKLITVARGSVAILKCPKLCFVKTIDWPKIARNITLFDRDYFRDDCPSCPSECNNFCWNSTTCQTCRDSLSNQNCEVCRNFTDGDSKKCVDVCDDNKYKLGYTCITFEKCKEELNETMFTLEDRCTDHCPTRHYIDGTQCLYCGDNCTKICNETVIDSVSSMQSLEGCTIINGSLIFKYQIKGSDSNDEEALIYYLGEIREIRGFLKVANTKNIKSLFFLSKLEKIGFNLSDKNSTVIHFETNSHLIDLFLPNVTKQLKVADFRLSIHYNPGLCLKTIEEFIYVINKSQSYHEQTEVSQSTNGNKGLCNVVDMNVTLINLTSQSMTLTWEKPFSSAPEFPTTFKPLNKVETQYNMTRFAVYYVKTEDMSVTNNEVCANSWNSKIVINATTITLTNLEPYVNYSVYIRELPDRASQSKQTNITYIHTLPDDPSPPENSVLKAVNSSSLLLSWNVPSTLNGTLLGYKLYFFAQHDSKSLMRDRNFCDEPFGTRTSSELYETEEVLKKCDCSSNNPRFGELCYQNGFEDTCKRYTYEIVKSRERRDLSMFKTNHSVSAGNTYEEHIINGSRTNFTINDLQHFTLYVFLFMACNHANVTEFKFYEKNKTYCSSPVMLTARTLKNETADIVTDLSYHINGNKTYLTWTDPVDPNQMILSYKIQYTKNFEKAKQQCITHNADNESGNRYVLVLEPGSYSLMIQSLSLAGESKYSQLIHFEIVAPSSLRESVIPIVVVFILLFIGCVVGIVWYKRYRNKHNFDNFLFASINPDYSGAIYEADEWEMERENIEISTELGKGTFGMVYNGLIKSQNIPCAVKIMNKDTNLTDHVDFLNEASVMKSFNTAHHVVKLLGVVSKGQPPLVIMELMTRGDLKSYLRRCRPQENKESSNSITCVETYRMACEIADGMMYLAAKKFIHRDLAARNCMVSSDYTVKIGDFGMARDIYETDYYRKETKGLLPVRWMAPESLADGVFTSDSDVWSYGIVLWEIATLAEQPYQGLANEQVFQFIVGRGILDRPVDCPDLLYEIMQVCWNWKPINRPQFTDIVAKLESHVGQDFRLVSFFHSKEGDEFRMNGRERTVNPPALLAIPETDDYVHWNTSDDDEVSLYTPSSRPKNSLSFMTQRSKPSSNFRMETGTPKRSFLGKSDSCL